MKAGSALVLVFLLGPAIALAQTESAAAERARLANQRIQAEMERRERAEEQQREEAARQAAMEAERAARAERQPVSQADPVTQTPPPDRPPAPPAASENVDLSEALEQLRTLGELRDAGYVTDEEFARIKKKILDRQFWLAGPDGPALRRQGSRLLLVVTGDLLANQQGDVVNLERLVYQRHVGFVQAGSFKNVVSVAGHKYCSGVRAQLPRFSDQLRTVHAR